MIVGSITTGQVRSGAASQAASGVSVMVASAPCWVSVCVTAVLWRLPYGEAGSSVASIMNGAGMVKVGASDPSAVNPIEPSEFCVACTPPVLTVKANDAFAASGLDSTRYSFTPSGVTLYTRSAPSHTPP